MSFDIFRLDWIFIDTLVVISLLLFLIWAKLFKKKFRWRSENTNISLEHIELESSEFLVKPKNITINKIDIIRNKSYLNNSFMETPIILIKNKQKVKLLNILTEGLTSYGYTVISLEIRFNSNRKKVIKEIELHQELFEIISQILNILKKEFKFIDSKYLILNYNALLSNFAAIISDKNNAGSIFINPKCSINDKNLFSGFNLKDANVSIISNKEKNLLSPHKNFKKLLKNFSDNDILRYDLFIIENSRRSFKYYETILLGIIIKKFELMFLKS
jgi:hypothetical protein